MAEHLKIITQKESWAQEVNDDVVDKLRSLLRTAESGEIQGFVFVAETVDNMVITCATKNNNQAMIIGGIERIKYRMLSSTD